MCLGPAGKFSSVSDFLVLLGMFVTHVRCLRVGRAQQGSLRLLALSVRLDASLCSPAISLEHFPIDRSAQAPILDACERTPIRRARLSPTYARPATF
jgi:hypothetical protein